MKKTYLIEDLCCANCANKIETGIQKLDGVTSASLNFIAQKLFLCGRLLLVNCIQRIPAATIFYARLPLPKRQIEKSEVNLNA